MSTTLAVVRNKVRMALRDRDRARYIFSTPEITARINAQMRTLAGLLKLGNEVATLTLVADTDTYTLPDSPTKTYAQVIDVARDSDNYPVTLETRETFSARLVGSTGTITGRSRGLPFAATIWEEPDGSLKMQIDPVPRAGDLPATLSIFRSTEPVQLTADTDTIPFDKDAEEALVYATAAELVDMAPDDALEQVRLSRQASEVFRGNVSMLVRAHDIRRARQRATQKVRRTGAWT